MKKYFNELRQKNEQWKADGASGPQVIFYRLIFLFFKWAIIIFTGSGYSFPLIFQTEGAKSVGVSYKEFKSLQKTARIIFFVIVIAAVVWLKAK